MRALKVKDHDDLIRDPSSHAVINIDDGEYRAFKLKREAEIKKKALADKQAEEIRELKAEMSEIKNMLKILIEGK